MTRHKLTPEEKQSLLDDAVSRIQEMTVDGRQPTAKQYNAARNGALSTTGLHRHGVTFGQLLEQARGTPYRTRRPATPTAVPPEVEAEIQAAFARGDHIDQRRKDWPLFAIPTRVETVLIPQGDATALKITRYYASIR